VKHNREQQALSGSSDGNQQCSIFLLNRVTTVIITRNEWPPRIKSCALIKIIPMIYDEVTKNIAITLQLRVKPLQQGL
jgi:hypothetical protein